MNIKPLSDFVILKTVAEETTQSGIIVPGERPEKGEVMAVGSGRVADNGTLIPLTVKIGDQVMFKKYAPDTIKIGDETFFILRESDIIAVIQ